MELDLIAIRRIVCEVITTRPDEIDCGRCFDELDRFAELVLAGRSAAEAFPMVQEHLEHCWECREELEALCLVLSLPG